MVTVVILRPALAERPLSTGAVAFGVSGGGPKAPSSAPSVTQRLASTSKMALPSRINAGFLVLFAIFRGPESLSHFPLLHQRERIVDFLHDDDALRCHRSDDSVEQPIVHMCSIGLAVGSGDNRHVG